MFEKLGKIWAPVGNILDSFDAEMRYRLKHNRDGVKFFGNVRLEHFRDGQCIYDFQEPNPNIFTTEGLNYLNDIMWFTTSKAASKIWYVGIFKANVTPAAGDTAAAKLGAAGTYQECQDADYDDPATNKPSYNTAASAAAVTTNSANKAEFTIAASITVYGAFLGDEQAKTATNGTLMCAKKFSASRAVIDDDVLYVTYQITASSS